MGDELATSNVTRSYSLAATSIAIFTFMLFFLYPRYRSGEIDALPFQATLVVMGVATFSFVFASLYYYSASLGSRIDDAERARHSRRADRFWLLGYTLLFLAPSLILFSLGVLAAASAWFALWLVYLFFVIRYFPKVQTTPLIAALVGFLAASDALAQSSAYPVALQWGVPTTLPPSALVAVASGDPTAPVETTFLLSMPAGYRIPPHFHPGRVHVAVREGTLLIGMGDKLAPLRSLTSVRRTLRCHALSHGLLKRQVRLLVF